MDKESKPSERSDSTSQSSTENSIIQGRNNEPRGIFSKFVRTSKKSGEFAASSENADMPKHKGQERNSLPESQTKASASQLSTKNFDIEGRKSQPRKMSTISSLQKHPNLENISLETFGEGSSRTLSPKENFLRKIRKSRFLPGETITEPLDTSAIYQDTVPLVHISKPNESSQVTVRSDNTPLDINKLPVRLFAADSRKKLFIFVIIMCFILALCIIISLVVFSLPYQSRIDSNTTNTTSTPIPMIVITTSTNTTSKTTHTTTTTSKATSPITTTSKTTPPITTTSKKTSPITTTSKTASSTTATPNKTTSTAATPKATTSITATLNTTTSKATTPTAKATTATPQTRCSTESCIKAANMLSKNMNENVLPCENFYEFACGGWMKNNPLRASAIAVRRMFSMHLTYEKNLISLLKKGSSSNSPKFLKMLKEQNTVCNSNKKNNAVGITYLKTVLRKLGGWSVIAGVEWNESNFDITNLLINISKMGLGRSYIFNTKVDDISPPKYIISIHNPSFAIDEDNFYSEESMNKSAAKYIGFIKSAVKDLGEVIISDNDELRKIFNFEAFLFQLHKDTTKKDVYVTLPLNYLQRRLSKIDLTRYVREIINPDIPDSEKIDAFPYVYMLYLTTVLKKTENRAIVNYLLWRVVSDNLRLIHTDSSFCLSFLLDELPVAIASLYAKAYFSKSMRTKASSIVPYFKSVIIGNIMNATWMTPSVKIFATRKANNTFLNFPFAAEFLNDTVLNKYFENLTFGKKSYLENIVNLRKWTWDREYKQYGKKFDRKKWDLIIPNKIFQTSHWHAINRVEIGMGALQVPMYDENLPNYLNFGGIGSSLGHEIMHGIINPGHKYGIDGLPNNWWDGTTTKNFQTPKNCLEELYSNFTFLNTKYKLDGRKTFVENFVDHTGFRAAYGAYLLWEKDNGPEPLLHNLNYTPKQLFWINLANKWCSNFTEKYVNAMYRDTHSPAMYRILGTFPHFKEFTTDFNCSPESKMNAVKKCETL